VRPDALLLTGQALYYETPFFRVNQIIPRPDNSQALYLNPRFFQLFDCGDPKRGSVSKSFENIEFKTHFEPPDRTTPCYPEQSHSYVVHLDCHSGLEMPFEISYLTADADSCVDPTEQYFR
jgi:hypothetical protein